MTLSRCSDDVSEELNDLKAIQEKQSHGLTTLEAIKNLSKPHVRSPFIIIVMNFMLTNFSGCAALIFYAVGIFKQAGIDENEHLAAIIIAIVRIFGGVLAILMVQKLPRRVHAMICSSLMGLSTAVLGLILYLKSIGEENKTLNILPIISVTLYMLAYGAGGSPLMFVFVGELLPPEYKVLSGVIFSLTFLIVFMVTKMFSVLLVILTPFGTYWLYASFSIMATLFYYFFLPETKGKTLLEIQSVFKKNKIYVYRK